MLKFLTMSCECWFIFDFDGTLADSFRTAHHLFNQLATRYGYHPVEERDVELMRRKTAREFFTARGISQFLLPVLAIQGRRDLARHIAEVPPVAGIAEVLPRLKQLGHHLGILTSNATENVEAFLHTHQLQNFFDFIYCSRDMFGKDRRVKALMRKYRLAPEQVIYVGDTDADVLAAQKAGIRVAAVTWGYQAREVLSVLNPTWLLDTPSQLAEILPP